MKSPKKIALHIELLRTSLTRPCSADLSRQAKRKTRKIRRKESFEPPQASDQLKITWHEEMWVSINGDIPKWLLYVGLQWKIPT